MISNLLKKIAAIFISLTFSIATYAAEPSGNTPTTIELSPPSGKAGMPSNQASSTVSTPVASAPEAAPMNPVDPNHKNVELTPQTPTATVPVIKAATPSAGTPISNIVPTPPPINAAAYLLMDANSGNVIAQNNADVRRPPASLTKLMTMYVISGLLQSGRIKPTDLVTISENAWRTGGSKMFVQVGTQVPVQDLIQGIIVASGNDACVAMAEHVAGSEASFVDLMNRSAQKLGMNSSHYADSTGLPSPQNYTTARDLAKLTRAIIYDYPNDYQWYSQKWMMYNQIKQPNRNLLLWRDPSVDGLKTGHTEEAGYCLVASAKRNETRLIAIVLGSPSMKQRASDVQALLNYGYSFFETHKMYDKNKPITELKTWFGKQKQTALGVTQDLYVTAPVGQYQKLKASVFLNKPLHAPIVKGQSYGEVRVFLNNQVIAAQPLVALENNPKAGFFSRSMDRISLMFNNWFGKSK